MRVRGMKCANGCGADIRPTRPGDGIDPADYQWVHVSKMTGGGELASPVCGLTPVATPPSASPGEVPPLIRDLLAELPSARAFPAAARSRWLGAMRAAMLLLWPADDDESADLDWWEARANIIAAALRTAAAAEPPGSPAAQVYQAMLAGMTERYGDPGPLFPAGDHNE